MKDYILFSAVGGHDPIANYHDGAILHICRLYRPRKVYLYLSKEMIQRSDMDNRYVDSLERLQKHLDYKMEHIELIKRENLTEVQLFDTFYQEFEPIINRIQMENPESSILLNTSSGTPAMKSALEIIAALSLKDITAVQVATPQKKENPKDEDPMKYDLELFWDLNEDNGKEFINRCIKIESSNLLAKVQIESIKKLIHSYDYHAALLLAEEIKQFINPLAIEMLRAAVYRSQLNLSGYGKIANANGFDFLLTKDGAVISVVEYILLLQVKRNQGNYADFIRALSPVILDVFDIYLKKKCSLYFKEDYCEYNNVRKLYFPKLSKMDHSKQGKDVKKHLLNKWSNTAKLEGSFYKSAQLLVLINGFSNDDDVKKDANSLRNNVEEGLRNSAAHEIVSVTEDIIIQKTGMNSQNILNALKNIVTKAGYNIKKGDWESYEKMNDKIIKCLSL